MKLIALVLALSPFVPIPRVEDAQVDYPAILAQARERYGLESVDLSVYSVEELLDGEHFLRVELGPFDLRLPVHAVTEKSGAALVAEAASHMLDLLDVWADWKLVDASATAPIHADVERLRKWSKSWSEKKFELAAKAPGESLFERMGADEEVRAAGVRLAEALSPRFEGEFGGEPAQVVLAPTRETFAELDTLAGAIEPDRKSILWGAEAVFYSAAWSRDAQIVALEYAAWPWNVGQPFAGDSMNAYVKTGRRQHVVDRAAESLARVVFDSIATPLVEQALRTNLVIAVVGSEYPTFNTWSFQWSRAGGSTPPYSRFVPGGNSGGGTLPPRPASPGPTSGSSGSGEKTPWRENDGRDHFFEALATGQKKGQKLASRANELSPELRRDKHAHFAVGILGKGEVTLVSAPFLGEEAEQKPLPQPEFIDEYEEFFRAYRTGFLHWLRTEGHPDGARASPAAFARFLERLRQRGENDTLSSMVQEVYGLPLSSADGTTDSLEWRFLARVGK